MNTFTGDSPSYNNNVSFRIHYSFEFLSSADDNKKIFFVTQKFSTPIAKGKPFRSCNSVRRLTCIFFLAHSTAGSAYSHFRFFPHSPLPSLSRSHFLSYSWTRHLDHTFPANFILCISYSLIHSFQIRNDPL